MSIVFEAWHQAIVIHCTFASLLIFWLHYPIVLPWCLYIICEKYVFACALQQSHLIHTVYCSRLCLMESIQRGSKVFSYKRHSASTFISTSRSALFLSFVNTRRQSQISSKEGLFRAGAARFEGQAYHFILLDVLHFIYFIFAGPISRIMSKDNFEHKTPRRTFGEHSWTLGMGSKLLLTSSSHGQVTHGFWLNLLDGFGRQGGERSQITLSFRRQACLRKSQHMSKRASSTAGSPSAPREQCVVRNCLFVFFSVEEQLLPIRIYLGALYVQSTRFKTLWCFKSHTIGVREQIWHITGGLCKILMGTTFASES